MPRTRSLHQREMYRFDDLRASSRMFRQRKLTAIGAEFIAQQWLSVLRTTLVDNIVQIFAHDSAGVPIGRAWGRGSSSVQLSISLYIKQLPDMLGRW